MDEKALVALRNGLEDSYWYGDDDEKVFNELVRKAEAFDTLLHTYERYRHSHAHDLKLLLGMKAIDLLKERVEE